MANAGKNPPIVTDGVQIRRLTPLECERLQGFPDGWTDVQVRDRPTSNSARYKALGNSWAVPCARAIGERLQIVENITRTSVE